MQAADAERVREADAGYSHDELTQAVFGFMMAMEDVDHGDAEETVAGLELAFDSGQRVRVVPSVSGPDPGGVRTIATRIIKEIKRHGRIVLRGERFANAQELAVILQIFRDPRFETFRYVYVRGNEIVEHEAYSSGVPGSAPLYVHKEPAGSAGRRQWKN